MPPLPAPRHFYQIVAGDKAAFDPNSWTESVPATFVGPAGEWIACVVVKEWAVAYVKVSVKPTITPIPDQTAYKLTSGEFTPTVAGTDVSFSVTAPNWVTVNPTTGKLTWLPPADFFGPVSVTLTASNFCGVESDTFTLTVESVAVVPAVATNGGVTEADLGATYRYTFTPATFNGTAPITVVPVLTVGGVDRTADMVGNVYTATKAGSTQSLAIEWRATNAAGGPVASTPITRMVPAASVATGLRAQVDQLEEVGQTGPRTPPTKVYGVDTLLPPGVTDVGGTLVVASNAVLEGWSNIKQVDLVGDNAILRDCVIDNTAEANAAGYPVHITGNGCTVEYCTVKLAGLPSNSLGGDAPSCAIFNDNAHNTTIRRNWTLDYPIDGIKSNGDNVLILHNLIDRAVAKPVEGYPVYDPALSYPRGSRVQIANDPTQNAAAIVDVLPGQAPEDNRTKNNAFWNGLDVHTDQITIFGGSGAIRQNVFRCDPATIIGPTQQIRVVRNTFSPIPIGKFEISGNVMKPWAGSSPLDAHVIRTLTSGTVAVGGFVSANVAGALRFYTPIVASSLATQGPATSPERWQEVTDINATDSLVVLAHNWLAAGNSGVYASWGSSGDTIEGNIIYGPNRKEIDGADAMSLLPDFQVADLTIPEPLFGQGVTYTPAVSSTGSDFTITPTSFGKFKVGGVLIDACVIRSGSRIICWMTPDGTVTTRASVPATVEDLGTSFRVKFINASGAPIDAPLAVAAGTAAVVDNNGTLIASIIGQSENVIGFAHNGPNYTAGPYPVLLPGVDAQIALHKAASATDAPDVKALTSANITARAVNPGFVALANLWHLGSGGRPIRLVADVQSSTGMEDMMEDGATERDFADSVALVAAAGAAWGEPITSVTYNWWNNEAAVAKTLWNSRAPHFFGINPDGTPYDFAAGPLENCLIDTTNRGFGLLPANTKVNLMLPGPRLTRPGNTTQTTPHINYLTRADGVTDGMSVFSQLAVNAYAMRDDFIARTPQLNRGKVTIAPNLVRFGDYTNGVKDAAPSQTEIHPGSKDKDGQILFSQDVAASLLISEGYAQVSRYNRVTQLPDRKTFDFVFRIPPGGVLTTQRLLDTESVASPRPHQQQVMGFEVARGADTLQTQRPLYRDDPALDTALYPVAYRGTATITNEGTDVGGGLREATVRVVMVNALDPGDRIHWSVTGGAGGWQLHDGVVASGQTQDHIDYDARLYRDGLRVYEARLDDGSATRYPGIPARGQEIYTVQSYVTGTAPSITTVASVSSADGGATVTYTFTPAAFAGSPTPTVARVLTLGGVDVTGAMSGNVYIATKTETTQALVMTYTAANGVSPNATSTASATVPATAAATFFTMPGTIGSTPTSGQNPRFTGLSDLPADTTGIRFKAKFRMPTGVTSPAQQNWMNFASTSAVIQMSGGRLRCTVEDASGNGRLTAQEFGSALSLDTWNEIDVLLDQTAGTVTGTINGTAFTPLAMNTTGGASAFATSRRPTLLANSAGVDPVTSGVQVQYLELSYVSSGIESVIKRIEGDADTVNLDTWKFSGNPNQDFV